MEDRQIIELYWERSDDAIKETAKKYGADCSYIANHILENADDVESCIRDCYACLWESIPPHRPQNLKAYLSKTTRNHALQMKYPEIQEMEADLFTAELVIHDFLKGLEVEQRKLFVAHYWYFSSLPEISAQYKVSESNVNETLHILREKLDDALGEKKIYLQSEAEFYCAMTEMEDLYLEEAAPQKGLFREVFVTDEGQKQDIKNLLLSLWKRFQIPAIACIVILIVGGLILLKNPAAQNPNVQNPTEQNPTESEREEIVSGVEDVDSEMPAVEYVSILMEGIFSKDDIALMQKEENGDIVALPIYRNLSQGDTARDGVYMDEATISAMLTEMAAKLGMNITYTHFDKVLVENTENTYVVRSAEITTDTGSIKVDARGKIHVSFMDGVEPPAGFEMSNPSTIERANRVVSELLQEYSNVIPVEYQRPCCYPVYDPQGRQTMHYRTAITGEGFATDNFLWSVFNVAEFYYSEGMGLTGFSYGDLRTVTELVDYYPIINVEEATALLKEGNHRSNAYGFGDTGFEFKEEDVLGVQLTYRTEEWLEYYQPYYCFYIYVKEIDAYDRFYVPAVEGAHVKDEEPVEAHVDILHLGTYDRDGLIYYDWNTGKYYTLKNGTLVEIQNCQIDEGHYSEYGAVEGEQTDNGTEWILYYKGEPILNLTQLNLPENGTGNHSLDAKYIEGQVIVFDILYPNSDSTKPVATVFKYSEEEQSLTPYMYSVPLYNHYQPYGLDLKSGRYPTMGNEAGEILIVDLLTGENVNTGILYDEIDSILSASDRYYAFVYKNGEVALIDKVSGMLYKKAKYQFSFTPTDIIYQDDLLYVQEDWGSIVFVIREFAP